MMHIRCRKKLTTEEPKSQKSVKGQLWARRQQELAQREQKTCRLTFLMLDGYGGWGPQGVTLLTCHELEI